MTTETLPQINTLTAPEVGTAATYSINGDSYPAVVVARTDKTVWIRLVNSLTVAPRPVGTGHEASETILDPEDVDAAIAAGKEGARKFMLRTEKSRIRNGVEEEAHGLPVGTPVLRQRWSAGSNVRGVGVTFGTAVTRRDPSF